MLLDARNDTDKHQDARNKDSPEFDVCDVLVVGGLRGCRNDSQNVYCEHVPRDSAESSVSIQKQPIPVTGRCTPVVFVQ